MKKLIAIFILLLFTKISFSQEEVTVVSDAAVREALVTLHKTQYDNLGRMESAETNIATLEEKIRLYTGQIATIETKLYESLSKVDDILVQARSIERIIRRGEQIANETREICDIIIEDPELLVAGLASSVTERITKSITDLTEYLVMATTGGQINLMNNQDRIKIIYHVDVELRVIRAQLCVFKHELLVAKRQGILRVLFPTVFQWRDRAEVKREIAQEIIENFEL